MKGCRRRRRRENFEVSQGSMRSFPSQNPHITTLFGANILLKIAKRAYLILKKSRLRRLPLCICLRQVLLPLVTSLYCITFTSAYQCTLLRRPPHGEPPPPGILHILNTRGGFLHPNTPDQITFLRSAFPFSWRPTQIQEAAR